MRTSQKIQSFILLLIFFTKVIQSQAQLSDSLKAKEMKAVQDINNQFSTTRFLDIQYEQLGKYNYTSKVNDKDYESGSVKSQNRLRIALNQAIAQKKNWVLSASLRYKYEHLSFENVEVPSMDAPILGESNSMDFHYIWGSLNYTRYDKLWGKSFVSNVTLSADGSNKDFGMVYGSYIGSLVIKRNARTTMTVGLLVQSNRNSPSPVLPVFSYTHRFDNSPWMLDIILPKQIYARRKMSAHSRLSVGSEFESNPFYLKSAFLDDNNKLYMYNRNEFKSGLMYEYAFSKHFIGYAKSGYIKSLNGSMREKYKTEQLSKTKYDGNFYFNVGISYNIQKLY